MSAFELQPVVGLFGTCGESTFRQELFIPEYERQGINYYNPQLAPGTWKPEMADIESDHLAHDVVQCWPVLGSTLGSGSLAETGYSIVSSLRAPTPLPKFVIPMIELDLDDSVEPDNEVARKESLRARKLTATHLANNASPNVFVVSSLDEMLETSIALYGIAKNLIELTQTKNPAYLRFMEGRAENHAFAQAIASGQFGKEAADFAKTHSKVNS